jgi:hypothetical protein
MYNQEFQPFGYTEGGTRFQQGVSMSCWPIILAISQVSWSCNRNYSQSKSVCLERRNYWYDTCQATFDPMVN